MTEARFDIWPVLEHYGWDLPGARGVWQTVKCGAHDDGHKSCRISSDAGHVKCMACGFSGDAIDVVRHYEGVGFKDAVAICEGITGGSGSEVRGSGTSRGSVSAKQGNNSGGRRYNAPRVRGRTLGRT